MRVRVGLHGSLEQYTLTGQSVFDCELPEGASVGRLTRSLGLADDLTSVILVNNKTTGPDHTLHEGDCVTLIPPLAGGENAGPPRSL